MNVSYCEDLWIKLQYQNLKYIVGVVYRHPSQNIISFHEALEKTLENLKTERYVLDATLIHLAAGYRLSKTRQGHATNHLLCTKAHTITPVTY